MPLDILKALPFLMQQAQQAQQQPKKQAESPEDVIRATTDLLNKKAQPVSPTAPAREQWSREPKAPETQGQPPQGLGSSIWEGINAAFLLNPMTWPAALLGEGSRRLLAPSDTVAAERLSSGIEAAKPVLGAAASSLPLVGSTLEGALAGGRKELAPALPPEQQLGGGPTPTPAWSPEGGLFSDIGEFGKAAGEAAQSGIAKARKLASENDLDQLVERMIRERLARPKEQERDLGVLGNLAVILSAFSPGATIGTPLGLADELTGRSRIRGEERENEDALLRLLGVRAQQKRAAMGAEPKEPSLSQLLSQAKYQASPISGELAHVQRQIEDIQRNMVITDEMRDRLRDLEMRKRNLEAVFRQTQPEGFFAGIPNPPVSE